jgi:hypothetical protein
VVQQNQPQQLLKQASLKDETVIGRKPTPHWMRRSRNAAGKAPFSQW